MRRGSKVDLAVEDDAGRLKKQLAEWTWKDSDRLATLEKVVDLGPVGTTMLASELRKRSRLVERLMLAKALGDATGEAGLRALREAAHVTGPGTANLRCTSLLSLATRFGPGVTPDLQMGLDDPSPDVRYYALIGLAGVGDERAWDAVFSLLQRRLKRPNVSKRTEGQELQAFCYLARHLDKERADAVAKVLKHAWPRMLPELKVEFIDLWPGIPDNPDHTEPQVVSDRAQTWFASHFNDLFRGRLENPGANLSTQQRAQARTRTKAQIKENPASVDRWMVRLGARPKRPSP